MCGIAGLLDPGWSGNEEQLEQLADRMAGAVAHRGPDDSGTWCDPTAGVALGHRRLSIIDLTPAGHQPMVSADGRWVIAYNGECYNEADLRAQLPGGGRDLRGHCDTEVVLEAVAAWGVEETLARLDAMFAMAIWDRQERVLHLVRDRLGEKPLYYSVAGRRVIFGSELAALRAHPGFAAGIDVQAVSLLLRLNYVPAPHTIYSSVRKLAAGSMVSVRAGQAGWPEPRIWWDFASVAREAAGRRASASAPADAEAADRVEELLAGSVARRLVADVPVGTFLSGGIDSSLITALAQRATGGKVRTFTVGFGGEGEDETAHAAAVARHLGTDHVQMDLTPADALAVVPELGRYWDEPFADPSQLPTLLLCREARRHVTVALSGDGGDEVFGGYRRYTAGTAAARWLLPLPRPARRLGAKVLDSVPSGWWDVAGPAMGGRANKLARLLEVGSARDVYVSLVSAWDGEQPLAASGSVGAWAPPDLGWPAGPADSMMAWDTLSTLPDEMLVKVDRASMAFALEVRPPLLDHRLVEAAWELPPHLRVDGRVGKRVLRTVLDRHVPRALVERPKTGFDPPLPAWLRGPLRQWGEDLLSPGRLRAQGLIDPAPVQARWRELQAGKGGREYSLWSVLVLQSWLDLQPPSAGGAQP